MTTWLLTPNQPDPITGLQNPLIGWHLTQATALDVLQGMAVVAACGYGHSLETVDISVSPPIYQLVLKKAQQTVTVNDTDWFACDSNKNASAITEDDINSNYTVTQQGS